MRLFGSLFFQFVSGLARDNVLSTFEFTARYLQSIKTFMTPELSQYKDW